MASMAMTPSFLIGSAAVAITKPPSTANRRFAVTAKVSTVAAVDNKEEKSSNGRREMMFSVAAAAAWSLAKVAMADDEEPKRGTEAAKKKYAQICVTMPTARVCRY